MTKILRLTELARLSKVSFHKIYFRHHGTVKGEMTLKDRTKIINTIYKELGPFFDAMGFKMTFTKKEE